ncbi:hypothetical protein CCB80_04970 [Armatimonadetes bacterium Uphvl-Ar1]|nr:hypothetical protein CCB80_04970 [Armatimonadetes bacterium Uphvl-Ar1]
MDKFATRAYRRPVSPEESNRIMTIYQLVRKNNDSYEQGIRVAIQAVLVNPNFLFRIEPAGKSRDLNGYELASRLSFFLWNSIPDQTLYDLAASGELSKPKTLEAQVQRMLTDPKAERFSTDFSTQWLQIRRLEEHDADPELFPNFNQELKVDLNQEVILYFRDMLTQNRPITEFINGKFTFLNHRLAKHYGISGDFDQNFRRIDVSSQNRGGLLGMGAILSVTSNPNRTSPVKRGKFIMEQILGTPPPHHLQTSVFSTTRKKPSPQHECANASPNIVPTHPAHRATVPSTLTDSPLKILMPSAVSAQKTEPSPLTTSENSPAKSLSTDSPTCAKTSPVEKSISPAPSPKN